MQLVLMTVPPGQSLGLERHMRSTQFVRVEAGRGVAYVDRREVALRDGSAVLIPPGAFHNIVNLSRSRHLRLYTLYSPPEHARDCVEQTQREEKQASRHTTPRRHVRFRSSSPSIMGGRR